ncbi:hypothetical protein K3757_03635 [Sulfitobacter sp. S223]|uniref:hypothetical protein n=1 Tax=Sulfitobacter sp. S223 TaxID=2867023 RepID=UPI0021A5BECC|nr:hypothetical protein [Sulfitobacter sp. S223]UWR27040.1 hypothetical protein K3757_03635 [Sulfitobacter sp. S223]
MIKSILAVALSAAVLAGCSEKGKESQADAIEAAVYSNGGPTRLTLLTMINNRTGAGAHSSLLVESTQSVLFDPAGSFLHEDVPERGDVLYGMSPEWVRWYKSAHARTTFHVVSQEIEVTPAQAARALQLVQSNGPVPSALCASATSSLIRQVPGFQSIRTGFSPVKLMEQMAEIEGVVTTRLYEDDEGNVLDGVRALPK